MRQRLVLALVWLSSAPLPGRRGDLAGRGFVRQSEALAINATQTFLDGLAAGRCATLATEDGIAFKHK